MGVWTQLESKLGLPRNDVGSALAAFLVGNYMFMALAYKSQQSNPQPALQQANLCNAARENLRAVGAGPERMRINGRGIGFAVGAKPV